MASSMFTGTFWVAAAERVVKSIAYSASAILIAEGTGLLDSDWTGVMSVAGMAGILSLLGSIASDAVTGGTGPSLTTAETLTGTVAARAPEGSHIDVDIQTPRRDDPHI